MPTMTANVATADPGRLINRLCKHFSHKIDAQWNETAGHLTFSIGQCELLAQPGALALTCQSESRDTLEELGEVVASHLIRFAGGEVEKVRWRAQEV